jgi:serine/threonine protein kinase
MNSPPPPTLIAGRYRVLRELGRGGMGIVYEVEHVHTGDRRALKVLLMKEGQDPGALERFKREARASARIKSDYVVAIVDADVAPELGGAPFLVMELLNGTDLYRELAARGRIPADEAIIYLRQAARALDKSHAIGIVHRDLKPENLFLHVREDGTTILKILDFGISKIVGGDPAGDLAGAGLTRTGAVMGTPLYMSPEQARGRVSEIGPATDVWALGLIAIQLLSGQVYWRVNTVGELMAHILAEPLYSPSERWPWLSTDIDAWFARSCAREPRDRFQSVGEQIAALEVALARRGSTSETTVEPPGGAPLPAASSRSAPPGARTTSSTTAEASPSVPAGARSGLLVGAGAFAASAVLAGVYLLGARGPLAKPGVGAPPTLAPPSDAGVHADAGLAGDASAGAKRE